MRGGTERRVEGSVPHGAPFGKRARVGTGAIRISSRHLRRGVAAAPVWYHGADTTPPFPMETRPAFTWKSALFGLAGLLAMASLADYQDSVCFYGPHMVGNHLPGGALTYVVFLGLVWNGLVGRLSRRLALGPKELAVVLCITLMGCFPPSSGLFRYATRIIMLPWYYLPGRPEWAEHGLLDMIEPALFSG